MIFGYDELKECVKDDFTRFLQMGFNEKQIFPAVLNEYEHGEDFNKVEKICIHIFLVLNYAEKNFNYEEIVGKLELLINEAVRNQMKVELGNEYTKLNTDLDIIMNN